MIILDIRKPNWRRQEWLWFHVLFIITLYYKIRQCYNKMRELFYYKIRERIFTKCVSFLLQNATVLLQNLYKMLQYRVQLVHLVAKRNYITIPGR